jgi:peptide chain release factor 1
MFANESGGHRWQRIPPTERHGRVQTSTITVAVMHEPNESEFFLNPADLDWKTTRGSGAGGQNRNKVESAVVLTHIPTKTIVRCESERSQHQNRANALSVMRARLSEAARSSALSDRNDTRKALVGSGMRGDKIRTIRCQDGIVMDHKTGRKMQLDKYLRGIFD